MLLDVVVNPLFINAQKIIEPTHEMYQTGKLPSFQKDEMDSRKFYSEFLSKSIPFVVEDGCKSWPALALWKDKHYLSLIYGENEIVTATKIDFGQIPETLFNQKDQKGFNFKKMIEAAYGGEISISNQPKVDTLRMTYQNVLDLKKEQTEY
mmetsp:Transcript_18891/g.18044  ORF Transcript_18891/g.18044 Transcript_18891/m.18044 type:complete len:151 (-) Transcript_18891:585-1037(-)